MLVFTSITKSYLPKARTLAISIKRFHPDWHFVLLFSDSLPHGFNIIDEPFDEILLAQDLNIPNFKSWIFCHSIVELCTATKAIAAAFLAKRKKVTKIMYLDPDIKVFNSLAWVQEKLDNYDIALTPHLLDPETDLLAIQNNEISVLKHGVFNLGFFAAKTSGQGLQFINWWSQRLEKFCRDDIPNGLFTDQRWCDLAPAFFDNLLIIRDRGFNVATWNITHRALSKTTNDDILAGDSTLRFYHFTGFDSGAGYDALMNYAPNQIVAHEIWNEYKNDLIKHGELEKSFHWAYDSFDNGVIIPKEARRLYRDSADLQKQFPDPFDTKVNNNGFYGWWTNNKTSGVRFIFLSFKKWVNEPRCFIADIRLLYYIFKKNGLCDLLIKVLIKLKGR